MPTWPAGVPSTPLRAGFSAVALDPVIRFQPDAGEPLARLGSTAVPRSMTYRRNLSTAERDALFAFFEDDCRFGSLAFTWTDPTNGDSASFLFTGPVQQSEAGPDIWLCEVPVMRLP